VVKESHIRGIRFGIMALSVSLCAPVLWHTASILVGLAAVMMFWPADVPTPWDTIFDFAHTLLVVGSVIASALIGWSIWKWTA
jgi:hypothetical protein